MRVERICERTGEDGRKQDKISEGKRKVHKVLLKSLELSDSTLMMRMEDVSETLVFNPISTRLIAREVYSIFFAKMRQIIHT
jgi:hypothetical protein